MTKKHAVYNTGFGGAKLVVHAPNGPQSVNKKELMEVVASSLKGLNGTVYTGQDLNTSADDMDYLDELCDYVLASIGSVTDANVATAHGVFGAVQGTLQGVGRDVAGGSFFVHGCGKVGSSLARQLVAAGAARVLTYDINSELASIPGCVNVSDSGDDWVAHASQCDMLCPCSISWLLTEEVVAGLDCELIVGAANLPFATPAAREAATAKGILFVPESVASAGAVIVDSLECFDRAAYLSARPSEVYAFTRHLTREGARSVAAAATSSAAGGVASPEEVDALVADLSASSARKTPAGARFREWRDEAVMQLDSLVIGGGMAGTAAAMELARLSPPGSRMMLLESRTVANDAASSFGESRMFRRMYSDEYFSKMQATALDMWRELEEASGEKLLSTNGLLFYGETDTGETVEGSVPGAREVMENLGIEHEYFVGEELDKRWPNLVSGSSDEGVFEHAAGSVNSSAACAAMAARAQASGVELVQGERVTDMWKDADGADGVLVATSNGRLLRAKSVVLCAGAWTNDLLKPLGVQLDLEVHNMHWGHFEVEDGADIPQWFCFRKEKNDSPDDDPAKLDGGLYYGFPRHHEGSTVVKVGVDWCPDTSKFRTKSMAEFCYEPDEHVVSCIESFLAENWTGIGKLSDMQCSPYTMTKDQYFILDRLEKVPEVTVFTGGNGRAFKFAPLIGKLLAELATGVPKEQLSYDVAPFAAGRQAAGMTDVEEVCA